MQSVDRYDYEIPEDIADKISLEFAKAFLRILNAMEKRGVIFIYTYCPTGTIWTKAFNIACSMEGNNWIAEYQESLEWWQADKFCGQLIEICLTKLLNSLHIDL